MATLEVLYRGGSFLKFNPLPFGMPLKRVHFVPLSYKGTYFRTVHPFSKPLEIRNNILEEHQALLEDMLIRKEVFVQLMLLWESRYSDFPTLSETSTCEISTLSNMP